MTTKRKRKQALWESAEMNNRSFNHYFYSLSELAIGAIKWNGLPDTIDERFLEMCLFYDGMSIFFNDEVLGDLALQTMIGGNLDVYRVPKIRQAYAVNGYRKHLDENDSVIIWNNITRTNSVEGVRMFARKLYEIDRAIDVNIKGQKTPIMILCDENQRLTMKNLYQQYDGNEPFIYGNKDLDLRGIQVLQTGSPFMSDKLMLLKSQVWNEALDWLGIPNVTKEKKERLLTDEVSADMGSTISFRNTRLMMRQQACEKINKMFGLNLSVEYRQDSSGVDTKTESEDKTDE